MGQCGPMPMRVEPRARARPSPKSASCLRPRPATDPGGLDAPDARSATRFDGGQGTNQTFSTSWDARTPAGSAESPTDVSGIERCARSWAGRSRAMPRRVGTPGDAGAIFDGQSAAAVLQSGFPALWDLDMGSSSASPTTRGARSVGAGGKLPEQAQLEAMERRVRFPSISNRYAVRFWHLPNGQTLRVFATARPQAATGVREPDREGRSGNALQHAWSRSRAKRSTISRRRRRFRTRRPHPLSNPPSGRSGHHETEAQPGTHIRAIEQACLASYDQPDGWKRFAHIITKLSTTSGPSSRGILELRTGLILDYAVIVHCQRPDDADLRQHHRQASASSADAHREERSAAQGGCAEERFRAPTSPTDCARPLTNIIGFADL